MLQLNLKVSKPSMCWTPMEDDGSPVQAGPVGPGPLFLSQWEGVVREERETVDLILIGLHLV